MVVCNRVGPDASVSGRCSGDVILRLLGLIGAHHMYQPIKSALLGSPTARPISRSNAPRCCAASSDSECDNGRSGKVGGYQAQRSSTARLEGDRSNLVTGQGKVLYRCDCVKGGISFAFTVLVLRISPVDLDG